MADATLGHRLAHKRAVAADGHAAQLHLTLLQLIVIGIDIGAHRPAEIRQLVVAADDLQLVAGEDHGVAIGDIEPTVGPEDAAHQHTIA